MDFSLSPAGSFLSPDQTASLQELEQEARSETMVLCLRRWKELLLLLLAASIMLSLVVATSSDDDDVTEMPSPSPSPEP